MVSWQSWGRGSGCQNWRKKFKESRGSNCSALSPQLQLALDSPLQGKPDWGNSNRWFRGRFWRRYMVGWIWAGGYCSICHSKECYFQ